MSTSRAAEFVTRFGAALLAASAPVPMVRHHLRELASTYGVHNDYLIVSGGIMAVDTDDGTAGHAVTDPTAYRLDQTQHLFDLYDTAAEGTLTPEDGLRRLDEISALPRTFGPALRLLGYWLVAVGLALRLQPDWRDLEICACLAVLLAVLIMLAERLRRLKSLAPPMIAFVVAVPAFLLADPLPVLVPLLAVFIPGAMLTIGTLELSEGEIQTGSARMIAGVHQLVILAFGIVGAASLVGATRGAIEPGPAGTPVGTWAPIVGVGLYAVGAGLAFCATRRSLPGLVVVVYSAWLGESLGDLVLGGYLSAALGAAAAIVVATLVHRRLAGPAPLLTVLPVFRILAPGGLGLLGVTKIAVGGFNTAEVGVVLFTFVAVALGMVLGDAIASGRWIHLRSSRPKPDEPVSDPR